MWLIIYTLFYCQVSLQVKFINVTGSGLEWPHISLVGVCSWDPFYFIYFNFHKYNYSNSYIFLWNTTSLLVYFAEKYRHIPTFSRNIKCTLAGQKSWWKTRTVFSTCCSVFRIVHCVVLCLYALSSVLWYPLRFSPKNDDQFVFTSSCL